MILLVQYEIISTNVIFSKTTNYTRPTAFEKFIGVYLLQLYCTRNHVIIYTNKIAMIVFEVINLVNKINIL